MSLALEQFNKTKELFNTERQKEEGNKVMQKVVGLVNYLGVNFSNLDGGELSEIQMKLAGYKFFLADYVSELQRQSEAIKIEIKETFARRWSEVTRDIEEAEGKVKNKEQVQNVIIIETRELEDQQILYESMYYQYRMKLNAVNDILTAIVQRLAELKSQIQQSKNI